ncbi:restriction endonuclease [Chimaeribacter arupi]|uniref:Restriction endonuclease n=1 Tax=Chimaeribacter arupi TaxID=2060066 RepID=A0A2N5EIM4_9GAMM|nr:restriction endonuclease [Chimaeribacter arupi]PLR44765.1 restriction endonuclease [Chimaeribacter arupi]
MNRNGELLLLWEKLNDRQKDNFLKWMKAFDVEKIYQKNIGDIFNDDFFEMFGDRLITHHFSSTQPLTKTLFEHAFNDSLNESGIISYLAESRTNPGHDLTINSIKVGLKTEAARNISKLHIHVSKWMELGKGEWILEFLLNRFLDHLENYERIFTLRYFKISECKFSYQLVEIPKNLLLEARNAKLELRTESRQNPKPGYGHVLDGNGNKKFSLYFDGGSERKLQIKNLSLEYCIVHGVWEFILPPP